MDQYTTVVTPKIGKRRIAIRGVAGFLVAVAVYVGSSALFQWPICQLENSAATGDSNRQVIFNSSRWAPPLASYYAPLDWLADNTFLNVPLEAIWKGTLDAYYAMTLPDTATPYRTHGGVI